MLAPACLQKGGNVAQAGALLLSPLHALTTPPSLLMTTGAAAATAPTSISSIAPQMADNENDVDGMDVDMAATNTTGTDKPGGGGGPRSRIPGAPGFGGKLAAVAANADTPPAPPRVPGGDRTNLA